MDDPTEQLLEEIGDLTLSQRDVAQTLALALEWGQRDEVRWTQVSVQAIARWGTLGHARLAAHQAPRLVGAVLA
jgi:hypothetical protein